MAEVPRGSSAEMKSTAALAVSSGAPETTERFMNHPPKLSEPATFGAGLECPGGKHYPQPSPLGGGGLRMQKKAIGRCRLRMVARRQ
jgi:hypothetical protein